MKRYSVLFTKCFDYDIVVKAKNKAEAREKAEVILNKNSNEKNMEDAQQGYWEYAYTDEVV